MNTIGDKVCRGLLAAWPESQSEIAGLIDVDPADLMRLVIHGAPLPPVGTHNLRTMLNVQSASYLGDGHVRAAGPYLLLSGHRGDIAAAFDAATGDGDVEYACEILPPTKQLAMHIPWHIVAFRHTGALASFLLIPRENLGNKLPSEFAAVVKNLAPEPKIIDFHDFDIIARVLREAIEGPRQRQRKLAALGVIFEELFDRIEDWMDDNGWRPTSEANGATS